MRLYIGNVSFDTTESELVTLFSTLGTVSEATIIRDRQTDRSRGFAFITMDDAGAQKAVGEFNGTEFGGRRLVVNYAKEKTQTASPRTEKRYGRRDDEDLWRS